MGSLVVIASTVVALGDDELSRPMDVIKVLPVVVVVSSYRSLEEF